MKTAKRDLGCYALLRPFLHPLLFVFSVFDSRMKRAIPITRRILTTSPMRWSPMADSGRKTICTTPGRIRRRTTWGSPTTQWPYLPSKPIPPTTTWTLSPPPIRRSIPLPIRLASRSSFVLISITCPPRIRLIYVHNTHRNRIRAGWRRPYQKETREKTTTFAFTAPVPGPRGKEARFEAEPPAPTLAEEQTVPERRRPGMAPDRGAVVGPRDSPGSSVDNHDTTVSASIPLSKLWCYLVVVDVV